MPNLKTLDIGRLDSTLFEKMKEYSFANIEELTTTSGAIPPLQLFPNLKALTLKNWSWQKQKALDFTVIPNTLERITLETEIASLPAWMYDVSNLKELVVNCNNKFPSGIDELSISVLKIKRTLLDKIPPDVLARLRAMDHLDIRYFD